MSTHRTLPSSPDLTQLKKHAKDLLTSYRAGDPEAVEEFKAHPKSVLPDDAKLADAQLVLSRSYGYDSWIKLRREVERIQQPANSDQGPLTDSQLKTLNTLHVNLARVLEASFSTLQQSVVDCDLASVTQTTYSEFTESLSNPCCAYIVGVDPMGGPIVIDFPHYVAYGFIERQMGGTGSNPLNVTRPLTDIERTSMNRVARQMLSDLEATWEALVRVKVSDPQMESQRDFITAAAPEDPVILVRFEVHMQHCNGIVSLCYPFETLAPIVEYLDTEKWAARRKQNGKVSKPPEESVARHKAPPAPTIPEPPAPITPEESLESIAARRPADVAGVIQSMFAESEEDSGDMSGSLKVAILLTGLGVDLARAVIAQYPWQRKQQISNALEKLGEVTAQQKNAVFGEAKERLVSGNYSVRESLGKVRDSLQDELESGFSMLRNVSPWQLMLYLSREHPQTTALIITQLSSAQAAEVLRGLPKDMQSDVAHRIAKMDSISPRVFRDLEERLIKDMEAIMSGKITQIGGPKSVAQILNRSDQDTESSIMDGLKASDPQLAEDVRNMMFVFDDIARLTDREIQIILKKVERKDLAVALKGGSDELKSRIFANVAEEEAKVIKEEMTYSGPVRMSDVEEVQLRIMQTVRQLGEDGEIKIVKGNKEDKFV
jgi:flagellar motor switch protein FliG